MFPLNLYAFLSVSKGFCRGLNLHKSGRISSAQTACNQKFKQGNHHGCLTLSTLFYEAAFSIATEKLDWSLHVNLGERSYQIPINTDRVRPKPPPQGPLVHCKCFCGFGTNQSGRYWSLQKVIPQCTGR